VPTSSPRVGTRIAWGLRPHSGGAGRGAGRGARGSGGDAGTCGSRREASLSEAGLLAAPGAARSPPGRPPPARAAAASAAGRGRDVSLHPARAAPAAHP
jgi:hypothetical protein